MNRLDASDYHVGIHVSDVGNNDSLSEKFKIDSCSSELKVLYSPWYSSEL